MENFFFDGVFYPEITDLIDDMEYDREELEKDPDHEIMVTLAEPEPFMKFDVSFIIESIMNYREERMSEEGREVDKIKDLLIEHVDFEAINAEMPILYYGKGDTTLTNREILKYMD